MKRTRQFLPALLVLLLSALLIQCQHPGRQDHIPVDPAFHQLISGFTSGSVSTGTTITVLLSRDYEGPHEPMSEIPEKLFDFSPSIKGSTYFVDSRTVAFRPESPLASDRVYKVDFHVGKLFELPREERIFSFSFQTIPQWFSFDVDGFEPYDPGMPEKNSISGTLHTADIMPPEEAASLLQASQFNRKLPVQWEHDPEGRIHAFVVDSVKRLQEASEVLLAFDGKPAGVSRRETRTVNIPAIGDFTVAEISVNQHPEQFVSIRFSDPLRRDQQLDGLIQLPGAENIRFLTEGNVIRLYPGTRLSGSYQLLLEEGILSDAGFRFNDPFVYSLVFEDLKPALRLTGQGVIIPASDGLVFPFEAVNLHAVDVRVIKIYEDNVGFFLQSNRLDGDSDMRRAGRLISRQTISLTADRTHDHGRWNTYSLDLADLIKAEAGAIYRVELGFNRSHSSYPCPDMGEEQAEQSVQAGFHPNDDMQQEMAYWDAPGRFYAGYAYYQEWNWDEMDNPCHDAYFGRRRWVSRNVLASDLGIIAKGGTNNQMTFAVTDLLTTNPIPNVTLEIYNLQQRLMGTTQTDRNGMADISLESKPFLLIAKHNEQRGYLRLDDGSSLSLSRFDVGGNRIQKGIKGFLYGERGVWRPGDSLFVCFILEDNLRQLPQGHPVTFELLNPMGQVVERISRTQGHNGFYNFSTATSPDAPTGNWTGRVRVGGVTFSKLLKIETIKPNRLKIDLDFGVEKLVANRDHSSTLRAAWLHGATARRLRASVAVTLQQMQTVFEGHRGYVFDDPVKQFDSDEVIIFDDRINEQGEATIRPDFGVQHNAPGMLRAGFVVRVFEEGGDYSIDRFSIPYSPYRHYVGMRVPEGQGWRNMLVTDEDHQIDIVTLDADGRPVSRNNLEVQVFKLQWRWWWDASRENLASFVGSTHNRPVYTRRISTENGQGSFAFRIDQPEWGRYLIRVTDPAGGHSTGQIVYVDWPGWTSRALSDDPSAAAMLSFSTDKETYAPGDHVEVTIPAGHEGRALVSLENGTEVISAWWVEARGAETRFSFLATPEMAPNAYIHVSLVQPHARMSNDLPIRMYGVIPLFVEDPGTRLHPTIDMPATLKPETTATVRISEAGGKKMTYTLALVDDGLLDLTRFATPDPWSTFYAREALGVRTWDMYDHVLGAFGGRIERVFSIGGDEDAGTRPETQANRFPPMVRFLGPYTLEKGRTNRHDINIPKYVGSVRVMVVAGDKGAYGNAEKTVPVKNPLMVLATLPRVLTPAETVKLPVTVFAMEPNIRNVNVEVVANELFQIKGNSSQQLRFTDTGDQVINFELEVASAIGKGSVRVIATSGREQASYDIEIDVRNPNPPISRFTETLLEAGKGHTFSYRPHGIEGTNTGMLEISSIPPVDFGRRLKYLVNYPHGCAEQVVSSAFPQLFLESVMEVDARMRQHNRDNVLSALRIIASYQRPSGGIAYWPGSREADDWSTTYAGHFMLEAEAKGYALPPGLRSNWLRYQRTTARNWRAETVRGPHGTTAFNDLAQAYRLYTLALAGQAEMGAMNRLREMSSLSLQARWRLAAAYALAGQPEAAQRLVDGAATRVEPYSPFNNTFGSRERDMAMILETLTLMDKREEAIPVLRMISEALSSDRWMSTQATAFSLLAVAKFAGSEKVSDEMHYSYGIDEATPIQARTHLPVVQIPVEVDGVSAGSVNVTNKGEGLLFARLTLTGIPETGTVEAEQNNLRMSVVYKHMDGRSLDIRRIDQGTDFKAEVSISNPGQLGYYSNLVLSQLFPSGWEIHNTRMDEVTSVHQASIPSYQDIRDDRVHTHFDLAAGETKKFVVVLNAAYLGRFYLPGVFCEAMYNNDVSARLPGQWVEVVVPGL